MNSPNMSQPDNHETLITEVNAKRAISLTRLGINKARSGRKRIGAIRYDIAELPFYATFRMKEPMNQPAAAAPQTSTREYCSLDYKYRL
jgi:hypothetical protein